jgi:DnaJ-class molecular chaperone
MSTICDVCKGSGIDNAKPVEPGEDFVKCSNCQGNGKVADVAPEAPAPEVVTESVSETAPEN